MKILVVDDEKDIQMLFQQKFRKEIKNNETSFLFAFSGEEALAILDKHQQEAVLILSDINMPGMNGLQLLKVIKSDYSKDSNPPFVMMVTAYGDDENYNKAMEYGADDFMTKPIDFAALKEKFNLLPKG